MPCESAPRRPSLDYWRSSLLILVGAADCLLVLAFLPSLADSLESWVLPQPLSTPPPPTETPSDFMPGITWGGTSLPSTLPADKAPLDEDTPVIGVLVRGKSRAYLLEALQRGPKSHVVNDVLGTVPISVTHCDISGCTRVFTGDSPGQPLDLSVAGLKDGGLVLKLGGHRYYQETSESLDENGTTLPCSEYPAQLTVWKEWQQSHPETEVYMGTIDEPTPPEAGGPRVLPPHKDSSGTDHTS